MCCNHHNSYRKVYKWRRRIPSNDNNKCKSAVSEITDTTDNVLKNIINDNYDYCCSTTNCSELSQVAGGGKAEMSSIVVGNSSNNSSVVRTMEAASCCRMCCLRRNTIEKDTTSILRNKSNYSRLLCCLVQNNKHYYYYHLPRHDNADHYQRHHHHPLNSNGAQLNFRTASSSNNSINGFKFVLLILTIITSFCIDFTTAGMVFHINFLITLKRERLSLFHAFKQ